jgi:hypothetical protein
MTLPSTQLFPHEKVWSKSRLEQRSPNYGPAHTFIRPATDVNKCFKKTQEKLPFRSMKLYIFWKVCNFTSVDSYKSRETSSPYTITTGYILPAVFRLTQALKYSRAEHWIAQALSHGET